MNYQEGFKVLPAILQEMKETSEERGTYFMVGVITSNGNGVDCASDIELENSAKLKKLLDDMGIPYIESEEIFRSEGFDPYDENLYTNTPSRHFGALGNALFAQGIKITTILP